MSSARNLNQEFAAVEAEIETMAHRFRENIVDTLCAGAIPDNAAVDDFQRFLRVLRERVDAAKALGAVLAEPVRIQQLRGVLEQIVNDENWLVHRTRWRQEIAYVQRINHRGESAPPFFLQLQSHAQSLLEEIDGRASAMPEEIDALETKMQIYRDIAEILDNADLDDAATEAALSRLSAAFGVGMVVAIYRHRLFVDSSPRTPAVEPDATVDKSHGNGETAALASSTPAPASSQSTTVAGAEDVHHAPVADAKVVEARLRADGSRRKIICPECYQRGAIVSHVRWFEAVLLLVGRRPYRCANCDARFWKWRFA